MREQSVAERSEPSAPVNPIPRRVVESAPLGRPVPKPDVHREIKPAIEFSKSVLLEENHMETGSRTLTGAVAVLLHVGFVAGVILAGLYFADPLNVKQYASVVLVAPAPPPPPPPPPSTGAVIKPKVVRHMLMNAGKLLAPTVIPKHIAEIKEPPSLRDSLGGVVGGVPGGVPGGQLGGVLGGVIGGVLSTAARPVPPPPSVKPNGPVRVGGHVRQPKVIVQVLPKYPVIARQTHIQGQVRIDAVLDEQGNVVEMKIISGHPLLYQAALDALKQWKYEPTYLNNRPIAVKLIVTINFQLGQ
jgi:periplasmic protein TonB